MDIPEGFELVVKGRGEQWTARLVPDGHTASKWSPPAIQANARTMDDAIQSVIAKCSTARCFSSGR
jgi:hypothetical protein